MKVSLKSQVLAVHQKYLEKQWKLDEDNYFIVMKVPSHHFHAFTVNDGWYDPLRRYYDKETAEKIAVELNNL